MCTVKSSSTHFLLLSLFSLLNFASQAAPIYSAHVCSDDGSHYQPNTTFQTNLNVLFSSLISNATLHNGFYLTNVSLGTPDEVKGLFLCRGDVSPSLCHDCVAAAAESITQRCTNQTQSIIWYDQCMLRYSNNSVLDNFFPNVNLVNVQSVPDSDRTRFNDILAATLNVVKQEAMNSLNSGKRFATKEANFTNLMKLYTLAQCTPDLSNLDCDMCFSMAISYLGDGKRGAQGLFPGCILRYELYPFYNVSAVSIHPDLPPSSSGKKSTSVVVAIVIPIGILAALLVIGCCWWRRRQNKNREAVLEVNDSIRKYLTSDEESLHFDLATIEAATDRFSEEMKIGEGGFAVVYKGTFPNGQEIAVKRLSRTSLQGDIEFRNEAAIIAQLQHRNLVRLLGFCLEGTERILVYEFIPNSSLDHFLFGHEDQAELDWTRRYNIIVGIARGIQYLHEDSRIRVIHRDLKASNVLLDADMNAKISDFGMAKIFHGDQSQENTRTRRVVGTYGYMSPEYAMHGKYSVKSDVFSFGVLVLEILTGKKNTSHYQSHQDNDLLGFVWKNWTNQTPFLILDPKLRGSYSRIEARRCIHIALLCVQENPVDRPSMATILLALNSYSVTLALPRQPTSLLRGRATPDRLKQQLDSDGSTSSAIPFSTNDSLITEVYPR